MAGFKERAIEFLKKGLTTTPKQKAFMSLAPLGLGCTGPLLAEMGKAKKVEDLDANAWARIELEREKAIAEIRGLPQDFETK